MATVSNDIDEIRRQMARIRRELHEDVREVVESAEAATDWKRYLRMYPWTALGVAFAIGYLIVPKRRRSVLCNIATQADIARVREVVEESREKPKARKGLLGMALGFVVPVLMRTGQSYALQYLEAWLTQQMQQHMMASGPPPIHPQTPGGPGHAGGPGGSGQPGGASGMR